MIDANILLDVLIRREDFCDSSKAVLSLCEGRTTQGLEPASASCSMNMPLTDPDGQQVQVYDAELQLHILELSITEKGLYQKPLPLSG